MKRRTSNDLPAGNLARPPHVQNRRQPGAPQTKREGPPAPETPLARPCRRFPNLPYRRFPNRQTVRGLGAPRGRMARRLGNLRHGGLGSLRHESGCARRRGGRDDETMAARPGFPAMGLGTRLSLPPRDSLNPYKPSLSVSAFQRFSVSTFQRALRPPSSASPSFWHFRISAFQHFGLPLRPRFALSIFCPFHFSFLLSAFRFPLSRIPFPLFAFRPNAPSRTENQS
jgi:hypothetical protein